MGQPVLPGETDRWARRKTTPKAAGPGQGAMLLARDMDRNAMQSEVGYLFSGLWRGKGRREEEEGGRGGGKK